MLVLVKILVIIGVLAIVKCEKETVLMTEVFEIQVHPLMFNWTFEGLLTLICK